MNNQIQLVLKSSTTELSLNDHELGIYLTPELDGLTGLPEIRTTSGVNAGYDGGWTSAQNYDARSITIRGVIANEDVATVEQLRRQLTTLAGQGKNEELTLDLVTQAGKAYIIQVRTIALEMSLQKVLTQQEFMLQLRADDPLIYDASETGHEALLQVAQATGGFTIDFELPLAITGSSEETVVNNEGLEQVPTITRMYGALHNPKIINQTTNQFMQIETDLGFAEGDWIEPSEAVSGKDITINGAPEGAPLSSVQIDGNTSQNGAPAPDAPVAVQTVTGENVVQVCGKNLADIPDFSVAGSGYAIGASSGAVSVDSTTTNRAISLCSGADGGAWLPAYTSSSVIDHHITGNGGSYTISLANVTKTITGTQALYVSVYTNKRSVANTTITSSSNFAPSTITLDSDEHIKDIWIWLGGNTTYNASFNIQLELGSTASQFEPYQEQSYPISLGTLELCKISWGGVTYQDKLVKIGDKWYKRKAITNVVLDGDENWSVANSGTANFWYNLANAAPGTVGNPDNARWLCSNYGVGNQITSSNTTRGIFILVGGDIRIRYGAEMAAADWKAKLALTPMALYYALATPTDTEITNEALVGQLEALAAATMYNPQTNITTLYADGNEQPTLDVSYFTDKNPDTRDELVIDSRLRTITLNGLDVYHLQAPGSEFLMLAPGENRLSLQSDITGDNGYAQVSYKQGYLSI